MYKFAIALFLAAVEANDAEGDWNSAPPKKWADSYSYNPKPKAYSYSWNPKPKAYSYSWNPKPKSYGLSDGDADGYSYGTSCRNGVCKDTKGKAVSAPYKGAGYGSYGGNLGGYGGVGYGAGAGYGAGRGGYGAGYGADAGYGAGRGGYGAGRG